MKFITSLWCVIGLPSETVPGLIVLHALGLCRFFWALVFAQLALGQFTNNPTNASNGTNLVCLPFGTCEPCPEDAVRVLLPPCLRDKPTSVIATRTVLPALWQSTSHALRPRVLDNNSRNVAYPSPQSLPDRVPPGRDTSLGVLRAHSREGARRLLRVLRVQPLHRRSRNCGAARTDEATAGTTGASACGSDRAGQERPSGLV